MGSLRAARSGAGQLHVSRHMEPTLFGIGKAEWELYNSFSNWLSAIGTLAAVIVSLYLARRSGRPRAKVSVGHRIVITPGDKREPPEVIVFRIVNTGDQRSASPISVGASGFARNATQSSYTTQPRAVHCPSSLLMGRKRHGPSRLTPETSLGLNRSRTRC